MLRDFVYRLTQVGESYQDALRIVSRAAMEGWYGPYGQSSGQWGVVPRMERVLSDYWSPRDAVLTWTLSIALDDRTTNPVFQIPALHAVWNPDGIASWPAHGTYSLSSRLPQTETRRMPGSTGYFYVSNPGWAGVLMARAFTSQGAVSLAGAPMNDIRWMIVRYQ